MLCQSIRGVKKNSSYSIDMFCESDDITMYVGEK